MDSVASLVPLMHHRGAIGRQLIVVLAAWRVNRVQLVGGGDIAAARRLAALRHVVLAVWVVDARVEEAVAGAGGDFFRLDFGGALLVHVRLAREQILCVFAGLLVRLGALTIYEVARGDDVRQARRICLRLVIW
jgi:hypothetical protein